jgi:hypothetical protein
MRAYGVRGHGVRGHDMRGHGVRGHDLRGHEALPIIVTKRQLHHVPVMMPNVKSIWRMDVQKMVARRPRAAISEPMTVTTLKPSRLHSALASGPTVLHYNSTHHKLYSTTLQ